MKIESFSEAVTKLISVLTLVSPGVHHTSIGILDGEYFWPQDGKIVGLVFGGGIDDVYQWDESGVDESALKQVAEWIMSPVLHPSFYFAHKEHDEWGKYVAAAMNDPAGNLCDHRFDDAWTSGAYVAMYTEAMEPATMSKADLDRALRDAEVIGADTPGAISDKIDFSEGIPFGDETAMDVDALVNGSTEEQVRKALRKLLGELVSLGFDRDEPINGGDAVDAMSTIFTEVTQETLAQS